MILLKSFNLTKKTVEDLNFDISYFLKGDINIEHGQLFLLLFPVVLLALYIGNRTIDKISKKGFQIFVHSMLVAIACTLLF